MSPRLLGRRSFLAVGAWGSLASALGRLPYGGRIRLSVPWPITQLDPNVLNDGFSALFAGAAFDPVFGLDPGHNPYPALAHALPRAHSQGALVTLREGLRTAKGQPLTGADLIASVARARSRGAVGLLGDMAEPKSEKGNPLGVLFPASTPETVARVLSCPLVPLLPRRFSPLAPDGTGAFQVELSPGRARLERNLSAARGAAYLDAIEVTATDDLAELLRSFESGATDIGWFGSGLYRKVKGAESFEAPSYALAVVLPGKEAGAWGAPGTLQALLDAIPAQQLTHLGLRGLPARASGSSRWGGPSTELVVSAAAPQLVAVARALAGTLSTAGHELVVAEKSQRELETLRQNRAFGLMVDLVRIPDSSARDLELALRAAASPEAARRAPRTAALPARALARELPLGVVGELAVHGAARTELTGLGSWQLGAVWWK